MVTEKDVAYVAELAHLELTEEERARMLKDLNSILGYIDRLNELDTANVEPMAQVAAITPTAATAAPARGPGFDSSADGFAQAMRRDEPRPCLPREEALRNAPNTDGVFFKVPKVIER
jgi:aspartyl-tRNA(Asn)/glutamyl-tRNA(Gln) amidotransferase subunit C